MNDEILHAILSKVYRLGATETQSEVLVSHIQQVEPPSHSFLP